RSRRWRRSPNPGPWPQAPTARVRWRSAVPSRVWLAGPLRVSLASGPVWSAAAADQGRRLVVLGWRLVVLVSGGCRPGPAGSAARRQLLQGPGVTVRVAEGHERAPRLDIDVAGRHTPLDEL